jgi:hypothetical protein
MRFFADNADYRKAKLMAQREKPKPDYEPSTRPREETSVVLFGGEMRMLPAELEELGLSGVVQTREIPGVPPTWKPLESGEYLLGRCVDMRQQRFDIGTPKERTANVLLFDTAVPGGFRSVWLGADLQLKLRDPIGKVYQIYYEGETRPTETSRKLNPMKTYRVMEIVPIKAVAE